MVDYLMTILSFRYQKENIELFWGFHLISYDSAALYFYETQKHHILSFENTIGSNSHISAYTGSKSFVDSSSWYSSFMYLVLPLIYYLEVK